MMNLRFERLEDRRLLASDLGEIIGTVRNDLQNDGNPANDTAVEGVPVSLFEDTNSNGTFDGPGTDLQVGSSVLTDVSGEYRFTELGEGTYFVQIDPPAGLQVLPGGDLETVTFNATEAMGTTPLVIDDFDTPQSVSVMRMVSDTGTTADSDADAANANDGGVRDLYAEATSPGNVTVTSQFGGAPVLSVESSSGTEGIARVTWDGVDGDGDAVAPNNLNLDFSDGGNNIGMLLRVSADNKPGAEVTLRLTSGAGNVSEANVAIQDQDGVFDGDDEEQILVPFAAFSTLSGTGVDFNSVTAIEMELDFRDPDINGLDARAELVGVVASTVKSADFTVLNRMALGDRVFADMDNDGVLDPGESGIAGVEVQLYEDTDGSGDYTDGVDAFLESTTTDPDGEYLFSDLLPGDYLVRVAQGQFAAGQPLEGLISSTGNETGGVAPDPDDNVEDDDNGYALSTFGVVTQAITLVGGDEPATADDAEGNTNRTLDLGFFGFDLVIDKQVDFATIAPGAELQYTVIVTNNGPSTAADVDFTDTLPADVSFVSGSTDVGGGSVSHNAGTVTADLGDLAPGATAEVTLTVQVAPEATGTLTNTASVAAVGEADTSNNTAEAETTVVPEVDLQVVKVDDDGDQPIEPGSTLVYTVTVTNNGPSTATDVTLTDTLPDEVTFDAGSSSPAPDNVAGGVLTYELGNLAAGGQTQVTITVTVDSTFLGTLENSASVTANEEETDASNNQASSQTEVAVEPASIAGSVYVDSNNNGVRDAGEQPIAGVTIMLTGVDFIGGQISRSTTTGADGGYLFADLLPGTYQVQEVQPTFFGDGQETLGSAGGTVADDQFSDIVLASGVAAEGYEFGEMPPTLSKRRFLASSS